MLRVIIVFLLFSLPCGAKQIISTNTDTIPCDQSVHIQKTFCPNCEAWSDIFSPDFTGKIPVEYQMGIYDKDGFLIFTSDNLEKGWNGDVNTLDPKMSVFVWKITYRYEINGPLYGCSGTVALIR